MSSQTHFKVHCSFLLQTEVLDDDTVDKIQLCPRKSYLRLIERVMKGRNGEYFRQNDSVRRGPEGQNLILKHFFLLNPKHALRCVCVSNVIKVL